MSLIMPFLAQIVIPTDVVPGAWHWMGLTLKELLILLGAVALVILPVVIWIAYFRKSPRQHSHSNHHHSRNSSKPSVSQPAGEQEGGEEKRYRRKRRRRRDHRPRNPTLAETGGLPPLRSEQPPDPLP